MSISRRRRWLQNFLLIMIALSIMTVFGIRSSRVHASPWEDAEFSGPARAALVVEDILRPEGAELIGPLDVFIKGTYATEVSSFSNGILVRQTFTIPETGDTAVLTVDLNRARARSVWTGGQATQIRVRYYVTTKDGITVFDGAATEGELTLERVVFGANVAAFRIRGWLEVGDAGSSPERTDDDGITQIEITLETVPAPENVSASPDGPSPLPVVDSCEPPECYDDPGYYYDDYDSDYYYDPSCGEPAVGYSYEESEGCEGDTYDPDLYDDSSYDGYDDGATEPGCDDSGSDYGGCDDSSSSGSSGCDTGSSGSGCGDSGSSGCGGCAGDTFDQDGNRIPGNSMPQDKENAPLQGGLPWALVLILATALVRLHGRD
jgi:uncharacterized membrane protein YgcG